MTRAAIVPRDSELFQRLGQAALERRCVFFAGLPGVGKSLLLQQLAVIAVEVGRTVHLLQWDVARGPFETPELLRRYPERDGVTHPAIRKAVGMWARGAVTAWHRQHSDDRHLLIGELPLIGNRLVELAQRWPDAVEPLLAGEASDFLVPVPSREVRHVIEAARAREMASPIHERERANAIPRLVQSLWEEITVVARELGVDRPPKGFLTNPSLRPGQAGGPSASPRVSTGLPTGVPPRVEGRLRPPQPQDAPSLQPPPPCEDEGEPSGHGSGGGFDPELYARVYLHLLRHRRAEPLQVTLALPVQGSVYDLVDPASELLPTSAEVDQIMREIGALPPGQVERDVAGWFRL
jgi:hypothetical protein